MRRARWARMAMEGRESRRLDSRSMWVKWGWEVKGRRAWIELWARRRSIREERFARPSRVRMRFHR